MKTLTCPSCGSPLKYNEELNLDYVRCLSCGNQIQAKDFVEVRHSGEISISGMANNERRVQLLFDYLDGMQNIDFQQTANEVLTSVEDPRVYLAYLLLNPERNKNYLSKYLSLVPEVDDFEGSIAVKKSERYYEVFRNVKNRVAFLLENGIVNYYSQEFILDQLMNDKIDIKHNDYNIAIKFLNNGICKSEDALMCARQINMLRDKLSCISPQEAVYDMNNPSKKAPWIDNISCTVTSCGNMFLTADGNDLIFEIVSILTYAYYKKVSVKIE